MFPTAATNKPSASQSFRNLKSSKPQLNASKSTIDDTNSINSTSNTKKPADTNSSSSNLSNKLAYSFNRTATLPKRFKEKFLNKSTIINQAPNSNKNTLYSSASVDSQTSSISSTSTSSSSSTSSSNTSTNSSSPKHVVNTNPSSSNAYLYKYKEQLNNLNKYVENFLKSIKYLEQIIKKKKFEIVSSSATAILESILDVYNLIQSFDPHNAILSKKDDVNSKSASVSKTEFNYHKSRINLCLANLIKWSDGILYNFNFNTSDFVNSCSGNELDKSLTNDLIKSINEFVEFFHKHYFNSIEKSENKLNENKPNQLERSSSLIDCNKSESLSASSSISSSSSIKLNSNDKTSLEKADTKPKSTTSLSSISGYTASIHNPNITSDTNAITTTTTTTIEDKDGMKSIKTTVNKSKVISANTYVTQTTILTTSSNKFNQDNITTTTSISMNDTMFDSASSANVSINLFNHSKLSAFSDLDRLALELSELSSLPSSNFLVNNVTKAIVDSDQAQAKETPKQIKSKTFTNEQCSYLLNQFETFAKQFSKNEACMSDFSSSCQSPSKGNSAYSTLDRSEMNKLGNNKSMFAFDSPLKSINSISSPHLKRTTLHVNSSFKHDLEQKHTVVDSVNITKNDGNEIDVVLNKLSDVKQRNKTSFIEKNMCIDEKVAEKILGPVRVEPEQNLDEEDDDKKENDPIKNYMSFLENEKNTLKRNETTSDCNSSETNNTKSVNLEKLISSQIKHPFRVNMAAKDNDNTDIDSVDEENDDDCNGNYLIFGANNLNPNFLLIDDDGDDELSNETASKINNNNAKANYFDDFCDKYANHSVPYLDDLDDEMNDYNDVIKIKNEDKTSNANCDFEFEIADLNADITNNKDSISATPINIQNESSFELVSSNLQNINSLSSLTNSSLSLPIENKSNLNEADNEKSFDDQSINSNNLSINKQNISNNDMILQSNVVQSQPSLVSSFRLSNSSELSAVSSQHNDFKNKIDPSVLLTPISLLKTSSVDTDISIENKLSANNLNTESRDVLSLLDVNHLLEYQSQSQLVSTSSLSANFLLNNSNPTHNPNSNTSILRGGHIDALIVLATSPNSSVIAATHSINNNVKANSTSSISSSQNTSFTNGKDNKGNFLYQEAFLTTYRTLIEPIELIDKLIYRYRLFSKYKSKKYNFNANNISKSNLGEHIDHDEKFDINRLKMNIKYNKMAASAARNSLSLLIRVIDDLGNELNEKVVETLSNFVFELLVDDELQIARLLRKKLLFKLDKKRIDSLQEAKLKNEQTLIDSNQNLKQQSISHNSLTRRGNPSLLEFKSIHIAEQMTLIDLNLFNKIELSEVLLWSTKQNEKYSPNLICFTEHFNNISYWARSRILEHENARDREKYIIKFLKIMKHLRKMNNFNSYLSILSAVDSGPIQRLDWPKSIIDTIKEFSALIDPKCGFKCLREAVAEAQSPCIPHIGLILQDLTILHIANPDYLPSGNINFWKRWQQFNILERLRCFRRCHYDFKTNLKIQTFFNNFEDFISEDAQYSLSEQLKPRYKHSN